ncbi:DUF1624 domain-containing protein [Ravibacter arvi]|uniref:DUF1624 domain-containing protein n=1 Tax=Ravibacter arvi TaxID=2051041 RepID=A0ABP8LW87_9BACT
MKSNLSGLNRIPSLDIVRGLVMVVMALDHTRDLIHNASIGSDPTDLATTTPALFLTRWVTHLCAPTFVFLSGASAFLSLYKKKDLPEARKFLVTRGLWLILLEVTVVNFGIWFDIHFEMLLLQVIAAIGIGFIALGLVLRLNPAAVGITGLVVILFNQLAGGAFPESPSTIQALLRSLFQPGFFPVGEHRLILLVYPPVPWIGILFTGYGFGRNMLRDQKSRIRLCITLSLALLTGFVVLRFLNLYGDPNPWAPQKSDLFSVFSFMNVSKYPPSLMYALLMLGIMFALLACAEKLRGRVAGIIQVYGKVPLFFYLVHWYLIHLVLFGLLFAQGYSFSEFEFGENFGRPRGAGGYPLPVVYLVWVGVVVALYPVCKRYGQYKAAHPEKVWLRYL